jgi:hypothetical protein
VEAGHRAGEPLVAGRLTGVAQLAPRRLGLGHLGPGLLEVEALGQRLDRAQPLRLLRLLAAERVGLLGPRGLAGRGQVVEPACARALPHRLGLGLLRDRLERVLGVDLVERRQPELLDRGVDRQRAQRVGVVELRHRRLPHLGRGRGLGQLDQRLGVAHRGGGLLAQPVVGGAGGDPRPARDRRPA